MRTARINEKAIPLIAVGAVILLVGGFFAFSPSNISTESNSKPQDLASSNNPKQHQREVPKKQIPPAYKCTPQEKQRQDKRFVKRNQEAWAHTACPDESWLYDLQKAFKTLGRTDLELYDIGCNKGYTSANFLASFAPEVNVNPTSVYKNIEAFARENKITLDKACGACGDCYEKIKVDHSLGVDPFTATVHCFEPSPASFKILEFVYDKLGLESNGGKHKWMMHNIGVYNESGTLSWHKSCADAGGGELCAIVSKDTPQSIQVPVVTVDDFAKERKKRPDILKIDAEGFDPAVLAGSEETLSSGETPLVLFEFNPDLKSGGLWHHIKLGPVIKWFDDLGYDCYFESDDDVNADPATTPLVYRVTGDCLTTYPPAFRGWSNILCALRSEPVVHKVLEDRTML